MSVDRDDRDLEAELVSAAAGQVGIPVDAICVVWANADQARRSNSDGAAPADRYGQPQGDGLHVVQARLSPCGGATWWNPVAVLTSLLERERERGE